MNKEKALVKNTAIISFGKICTQCISFFLLPLYTSILSTSDYGTVDLLLSYTSLLIPIVSFAIEQALFRYLVDVREIEKEKTTYISTTLIFAGMQCCAFTVIVVLIQLFVRQSYLPIFTFTVIACVFSATMLQLSRGLGDNIGYALGSFFTATVQILFNILFLVALGLGANGMLMATVISNVACSLILFFKTKVYKFFRVSAFDKSVLKKMLKYSLPLIPNQLSWWIMQASDKTIVAFFLGTANNGLLAVAHKFPSMYTQISNIFNISWTESAILNINDMDAETFFNNIINKVFNLFACAAIGIIVCVPFMIDWLVADSYFDAYYQIPLFIIASLGNVVVSLFGVIYVAHKKTKEIAITALYAALINAVSHLLMVVFIGLYAAAISSIFAYWVMAIYRYFHSKKYMNVRFSRKTMLILMVALFVALLTYYLQIFVLHIFAFIFVLVISVFLNLDLLKSIFNIIKRHLIGKA